MWKPIDSTEMLIQIFKGNIIADKPFSVHYIVTDISYRGYVTAMRGDGMNEIKMLPSAQLINKKWWVRE